MSTAYGEAPGWTPEQPRFRPGQLVLSWLLGAASLLVATKLVPGASDSTFRAALVVAAVLAVLNAVLPPLVAALRLPFTALLGFFLVLAVDALMLLVADRFSKGLKIDSFWSALGVALAAAAVGVVLSVLFGTNDDDIYSLRVVQRIARRSGDRVVTDRPGIVFLEIDGLALPVLQRAMRDGHAPTHGALAGGRHAPARRMGARPLLADRRLAGRHPARLERRHRRLPLGREGAAGARHLLLARGLRRARAAARDGARPARRRRREPRQPLLGRRRPHDPHRQPDGGRALVEPRLPRLPRERLQRGALLRPLRLGGDPGVGRGRASSGGATSVPAATGAASIRSCARRCA